MHAANDTEFKGIEGLQSQIVQAIDCQHWQLAKRLALKKACHSMYFKDWVAYAALAATTGHQNLANFIWTKCLSQLDDHMDLLWMYQAAWHHRALSWGNQVIERLKINHYPESYHLEADLLFHLQHYEQAIALYRHALVSVPDNTQLWWGLGLSLWHAGYRQAAEQTWINLWNIDPNYPDLSKHLGLAAFHRHDYESAMNWLTRAMAEPDADTNPLIYQQALCLRAMEKYDLSSELLQTLLSDPNFNHHAHYLLASMQPDHQPPPRAPIHFVRQLFEDYASTYELEMQTNLNQSSPAWLSAWLAEQKRNWPWILDAGCAVGHHGSILAPYAESLWGVDLSRKMLAVAEQTGYYHGLIQADLIDWLAVTSESFDLIVCFDVSPYFGDLSQLLKQLAQHLTGSGTLLLSGEQCDEGTTWQLSPQARYQHSQSYLQHCLSGLPGTGSVESIAWRENDQQPIAGWLICYQAD